MSDCVHHVLRILMIISTSVYVFGQDSRTVTLRGTLDQCRDVTILDTTNPVDSIIVSPALTSDIRNAFLLCMVSTFDATVDSSSVSIPGDLGRLIPITIGQSDSALTLIEPTELDSLFRTNIYQLVIPVVADTVVADSLLTTRAWNGTSGGVIVMEARSAMLLGGVIDVTGLGFAGGLRSADGGSCGVTQACDPPRSSRTAGKGQSPLRADPACTSGHRPWASGGGGGDAHNAGGGGGANGGRGGRGGDQYKCSDQIGMYGVGGLRLVDTSFRRLFPGGGGGGGHQNNSASTDGASGGGIIVVRAPKIIGDSVRIVARGRDVAAAAGNDGAGAGGGGGTVMIDACSTSCRISIDVSGGRGGSAVASHGPGGGGGGGRFIAHPAFLQDSRNVLANVRGGMAGTITGQPTNLNGAAHGENGIVSAICEEILSHTITVPGGANVGDTLRINVTARDTVSLCECMISHTVRLTGPSATAVTTGTQLRGLALVSTQVSEDSIVYSIDIPSRSSLSVPFLCVLSKDTSIQVVNQSRVTSTLGETLCRLDDDTSTIAVDVCGLSRRHVVVQVPFGLVASISTARVLSIELEAAIGIDATVRIYNAIGSMITEKTVDWTVSHSGGSRSLLHIDGSAWPPGVYVIVAHTTQGTRSIMLQL